MKKQIQESITFLMNELKRLKKKQAEEELTEEEKDAAHAKELGWDMGEYQAVKTADAAAEKEHVDYYEGEGFGETDDGYQSNFQESRAEAVDRADGDRLKDAQDEAEYQKYLSDLNTYGAGGMSSGQVNAVACLLYTSPSPRD